MAPFAGVVNIAQEAADGPDHRRARLAPAPPPVLIGGEIPLIDVAGFLAGKPGAAEKAAAELR